MCLCYPHSAGFLMGIEIVKKCSGMHRGGKAFGYWEQNAPFFDSLQLCDDVFTELRRKLRLNESSVVVPLCLLESNRVSGDEPHMINAFQKECRVVESFPTRELNENDGVYLVGLGIKLPVLLRKLSRLNAANLKETYGKAGLLDILKGIGVGELLVPEELERGFTPLDDTQWYHMLCAYGLGGFVRLERCRTSFYRETGGDEL